MKRQIPDFFQIVLMKLKESGSRNGSFFVLFKKTTVAVLGLALLFLGLTSMIQAQTKKNYVPEPKPVKSDIEIAALYYPGTEQMAEWDMVRMTLPKIKPLLGWYDEGNPEVIDWQIKWAAEHGITAFYVDWYWNKGEQRLDHWVKGFYRTKYKSYLKWAMMWANHNEKGAHSTKDLHEVTKFWIDNYFKTPEYYQIDGKPVVVVYNYKNIDNDLIAEAESAGEKLQKGDGIRKGLKIINDDVKAAGLKGVYFLAIYMGSVNKEEISNIQKAGFEATILYNYSTMAFWMTDKKKETDPRGYMPFEYVSDTCPKLWNQRLNAGSLPFFPFLPTGWNDLPRSFQDAKQVVDRRPVHFKYICEQARLFCQKNKIKRVTIGPINEWQEGSYIEPNEEYGFQMYDILRDAFCQKPKTGWTENLVPKDLGLGPYDYPETVPADRTSWEFKNSPEGWYRQPYGTGRVVQENDVLRFIKSAGSSVNRAAIRTVVKPFAAWSNNKCVIRMKLTPNENGSDGQEVGQLFWGGIGYPLFNKDLAISIDQSFMFPVKVDNRFHEYTLDLSKHTFWRGNINELWFNPVNRPHVRIEIDYIRFQEIKK